MNNRPLQGMTIVFTGRMKRPRFKTEASAHRLGAYTEPRVTRRTDWLVTGTRPGRTKLDKAAAYGVQTLTEAEYGSEIKAREAAIIAAQEAEQAPESEPVQKREAPEWARTVRTSRSVGF